MKIISFALWGENSRYTEGALRNAELAREIYPGWTCRFYLGQSVPKPVLSSLKKNDNTEIVYMDDPGDWTGMFWRFYPASDNNVDVMISRDCDSRLTYREAAAVKQWLESGKGFHIMRDHPYHSIPIMGGMWGATKGTVPRMKEYISHYTKGNFWQVDQNFLTQIIYPLVKNNSYVHDEFYEKKPFPYRRDPKHFVGQAYAGNDKILDDDEYFIDRVREEIINESTR